MKELLQAELALLSQIGTIASRRELHAPEEHAGEDLLALAQIVVDLTLPRNARRLAALVWGCYRTGADVNRAGIIFGFVRFSRLLQAAATAERACGDAVPAGFRM